MPCGLQQRLRKWQWAAPLCCHHITSTFRNSGITTTIIISSPPSSSRHHSHLLYDHHHRVIISPALPPSPSLSCVVTISRSPSSHYPLPLHLLPMTRTVRMRRQPHGPHPEGRTNPSVISAPRRRQLFPAQGQSGKLF